MKKCPRCGEGTYSNNLNSTAYRGHLRWCSGALLGSDSETEVCGSPNNINDNGSTIEDEYGRVFSRPPVYNVPVDAAGNPILQQGILQSTRSNIYNKETATFHFDDK